MTMLTPAEIAGAAAGTSSKKADLTFGKTMILGLLAGVYIGFGANLATTVGCDTASFVGNGIGQLLFGGVFAVGLMLVVIGGSELFTGNNMFMVVGALDGSIGWGAVAKNWTLVWIANFIGSLLLVYIVVGGFYGGESLGLFKGAVGAKALNVAKGKLELTWTAAFCRGILCNWLVCMAVWLAMASKDVIGKVWAIWFPIMAFVASGFEHSVANMYFIPMGLEMSHISGIVDVAAKGSLSKDLAAAVTSPEAIAAMDAFKAAVAAKFTWQTFLINNLIPVTLGNIVGGGFFVGSLYWFSYLKKSD